MNSCSHADDTSHGRVSVWCVHAFMPILTVSSPAQSSLVHFSDVDLLLSISQMLIYSSAYVPAADKQQLVKESLTRACYDKCEMSNTLSACTTAIYAVQRIGGTSPWCSWVPKDLHVPHDRYNALLVSKVSQPYM